MKYVFILIGIVILSNCGCTSKYIADRNLVEDPRFENWFNIRGLGGDVDDGKNQAVFPSSELNIGRPSWTIAQWGTRYNFADPAVTTKKQLSKHSFQMKNRSKSFTVNSSTGELEMGLFASTCYEKQRAERAPWPHLLISTPITDVRIPSGFCTVENIKKLRLQIDSKLLSFNDSQINPDLHSARFSIRIIIQNLTKDDDGYGDMLWFNIPIFDNRCELPAETFGTDADNADASAKFNFNMAHTSVRPASSTFFKDDKVEAGEESGVIPTRVDLIPWVHYAFQLARKKGFFKTTSFRDLYISHISIGWEIDGAYDGVMKVSNLSLMAEY